ncbi:type II secretion system F family protein [Candidatus Woesearchaeota archaeon]|nr:type II secretion system F family protein [Candidatus Woesearchaeota archaeon]
MIRLPFSFLPPPFLEKTSHNFMGISKKVMTLVPSLKNDIRHAELKIDPYQYLGMCLLSNLFLFVFLILVVSALIYKALPEENFILFSIIAAFFTTLFAFIQQILYPKLIASRRVRGVEKHLMSALQNMTVQMNSGVPLFDSISTIANSNYGELSIEFKKAVRMINSGEDFETALEKVAENNPSLYFRRVIWQILNGLKAGGDITRVIEGIIKSISEEQILQIQKYGSTLNPIAMFYMLVAVIMPSLGITFIIVLSSFIAIPESLTKLIFIILFVVVFFFQIMFLGVIKSKRPNLLTD